MATTKKKTAARKSNTKSTKLKKVQPYQSFKVQPDHPPFFTFRFSAQTIVWLVIVIALIISQLWIIKLQLEVAHVVEQQRIDNGQQ